MLQEGMTTEQQGGHNFEKPQVLEILRGGLLLWGDLLLGWRREEGAGKESHKSQFVTAHLPGD